MHPRKDRQPARLSRTPSSPARIIWTGSTNRARGLSQPPWRSFCFCASNSASVSTPSFFRSASCLSSSSAAGDMAASAAGASGAAGSAASVASSSRPPWTCLPIAYPAPATAAPRRRGRLRRNISARLRRNRSRALQRLLQLGFGLLRQRRLQDRAAVLLESFDGLVRRDLLEDEEEGRRARLQRVAHLILELLVDAGLLDLAHQRAETGADCEAEER